METQKNQKLWSSDYGKRQIFTDAEYSETIVEFQFVEREIMKCQLPIYIGKVKIVWRHH